MTRQSYEDYFKNVAAKLPEIQHSEQNKRFEIMDIEEVFGEVKKDMDLDAFCLFLDYYEGLLDLKNIDNPFNNQLCAFQIIRKLDSRSDTDSKVKLLDQAETIAKKIIAKMIHDAYERSHFKNLEFSEIPLLKVGPVFDNCYGIRVEFKLYASERLDYNPDDWLP